MHIKISTKPKNIPNPENTANPENILNPNIQKDRNIPKDPNIPTSIIHCCPARAQLIAVHCVTHTVRQTDNTQQTTDNATY
jgi:hypothetical protein